MALSCTPLSQSTILIVASYDTTYKNTIVAVIVAINRVYKFDCCILAICDGWLTVVARSLAIQPLVQHQKNNCHCFFCNKTLKICPLLCSTAYDIQLLHSGPCHTLAIFPCVLAMIDFVFTRSLLMYTCSLGIKCKHFFVIARSLAIWHKKHDSRHCSFLWLTVKSVWLLCWNILGIHKQKSSHIAMASCLRLCDTTKKVLMSLLLAIQQKYALASDDVKAQLAHKSKATSQQLCVWRAFWTSFFWGKNFETILISVEKVRRKKSWWGKIDSIKKHSQKRITQRFFLRARKGLLALQRR